MKENTMTLQETTPLGVENDQAGLYKDQFLVMLAHELRNPLASISNGLEIWKAGDSTAKDANEAQVIMGRQLQQIAQIIDDLLDVSHVTRGVFILEEEPVDLLQVINYAVKDSRPDFTARQQEISLSLPGEKLFVKGDAVRLKQVLCNLLVNASKYTGLRGHITVALQIDAGQAVIRVSDDGEGIAPELLPHIFNFGRLVQLKTSRDMQEGGLGLGLTLVRRYIELQGGTVEAKSTGLKKGSEFIIRLPMTMSVVENAPPEAASAVPQKAPAAGRRILVIEDNADSAKTTQILLTLQGHEVQLAFSGAAGIEAAQSFNPDVIILDIGLPGMNGYDVAKRLRELPATKKTRLIALSGYGRAEDIQKSREAGFDHHLVKPADNDQLLALLD